MKIIHKTDVINWFVQYQTSDDTWLTCSSVLSTKEEAEDIIAKSPRLKDNYRIVHMQQTTTLSVEDMPEDKPFTASYINPEGTTKYKKVFEMPNLTAAIKAAQLYTEDSRSPYKGYTMTGIELDPGLVFKPA